MTSVNHRFLIALPRGHNAVTLAWRLLDTDAPDAAFQIERRQPETGWQRATEIPITTATSTQDIPPTPGAWQYRVLDPAGTLSETITVDSTADPTCVVRAIPLDPDDNPQGLIIGDLQNNGQMGYVAKTIRGNDIWIQAFTHTGTLLWQTNTHLPAAGGWNGSTNHVPLLAWDVNNDGRTEVVFRITTKPYPGEIHSQTGPDEQMIAVDAETGQTLWQAPWPGRHPREMMTVGHLRGFDKPAYIVVQDETYGDIRLIAVDGRDGSIFWAVDQPRPGGHNLDIADIDEDGVQEVIAGGICYSGDGTVRWQAEDFGHTDISKPARIDPARPGLQIWYAVESNNPGVYLVDNTGQTVFHEPFAHAHYGWVARHTTAHPGLQPHTAEDARRQERGMRDAPHNPIFLPDGSHWLNLTEFQRKNFVPVHWDERPEVCFIIRKENKRVVRLLPTGDIKDIPNAKLPESATYGRNLVNADIVGDFRENIVTFDHQSNAILVLANPTPATRRGYSPWRNTEYRHDRSQHGSGYYVYLSPPRTDIT